MGLKTLLLYAKAFNWSNLNSTETIFSKWSYLPPKIYILPSVKWDIDLSGDPDSRKKKTITLLQINTAFTWTKQIK